MAGSVNDDPNKHNPSDESDNSQPTQPGSQPPGALPPGRRRRRRWPYVLLATLGCIIIGLIVLAIILPMAVSSQSGTRYLLGFLNDRLRGHVDVRKVDISWSGPLQLQGLTVLDPQRRKVLSANKIVMEAGLWQLVRAPTNFGNIELDRPVATIYMQQDQSPSLVQAVEFRETAPPKKPAASQPASPAPAPKGQLTIRSGSARIVKPDGQELSVTDISGKAMLDTLNNVQANLAAQLASGGAVQADAHLRDLVDDKGQIDINHATGEFVIQMPQPVVIAPVASFADEPGIAGKAHLDLRGTLDRGTFLADLKTSLDDFLAAQTRAGATQPAPATQPRPINLALLGRIEANTSDQQASARFELTGNAGTAEAKFAYTPSSQPAAVSGQDLIDALLTGKRVDLPNVTASVQGEINLQVLADAAPRFVPVRQDVRVTSGRLRIQDFVVRTEPQLAAAGGIHVVDVRAVQDGQPVEWQPINLDLSAHVEPNVGLRIDQGQLESGFAQADVKGTPEDLRGRFEADLARLDEQLRQLVDLGDLRLAGDLQGQFQLVRANEDQMNLTSQVTASNLRYASGEQMLSVQRATMDPNGSLVLKDNQLQRAVLNETKIDVDRQVMATAAARYDFDPKTLRGDLTIDEARIPYLVSLARGLGIHGMDQYEGYRGEIQNLAVRTARNPQAGTISASGGGAVRNLGVGEQSVADTLSLKWQDATYDPGTGRAALGSVALETDYLQVTASDVQFQPGQNMTLRGKVNATAQVKPTLAAVYTLAKKPQPPNVAGQFKLVSNLQTSGQMIGLTGDATIDDLQIGTGQQAVRQEWVRLAYDTQVDNQNNTITIRQADIHSSPLTVQLTGTVRDFRTQQVLDLNTQYAADWDQIMPIIYEFSPDMKDTVAMHGKSRDQFHVGGPAYQADARPVFRGVATDGLAIGWQSGLVYGLELGAARLQPKLADGKLVLPRTTIPASGGAVHLGATVDFTGKTPMLRMPGELAVLDNVDLNAQIGKQLLSYVNPLFSDVTGMEGKVSLLVQDIDLPLGDEIKRTGSGRGQFNMQNVRVQPSGAFATLVQISGATQQGGGQGQPGQPGRFGVLSELGQASGLGGQQNQLGQPQPQGAMDIRIGNPTFVISNGRINYDNFTMAFPNGVNMVFSGWVGFDNTVKMYVGVPVTAGLLQAAGVKGPVAQYASVLEGARVDVPIVGTRTSSKLDFADIKVHVLVDQAIRKLATQGVQQGLRTAVPGAALIPPGLIPGGQQQNQQQGQQSQGQQGQQQGQQGQQQHPGLPGEGILRSLIPGQK